MQKTRVYDLPTRLFHWLFASMFLGAFFIAKFIDDESPSYVYHMLLGFILALILVLRIIWGIIGSRYARFNSFHLAPKDLLQYFKHLISGSKLRTLGHNAASSWAALTMMVLVAGLAVTGFMMKTGGNKETIEDAHELLANGCFLVAILHVAGVVLHGLRHRDWIALSMITGKKEPVEGQVGIDHSYRVPGIIFLVIVGAFVFHLSKNYDSNAQSLNLFGNVIQLGETED